MKSPEEANRAQASIAVNTADLAKVALPKFLYKLWYTHDNVAKGDIDQNTNWCRHKLDYSM